MKNLRNNEGGFTLIEAMVAMMVCTVGLIAMAELLAVTLRMQQLGRNSTTAIRLAQGKIDELTTKVFGADAMVDCGGALDSDEADHNDVPEDSDGNAMGYKRRWVVAAGPDADPNLREVTVRVIPDNPDGRVYSTYDLTTVIRGVSVACP